MSAAENIPYELRAIGAEEVGALHLPAGQRLITVDSGRALCPNVALSAEPVVVAGQRMVYRILMPFDGALRLSRVE